MMRIGAGVAVVDGGQAPSAAPFNPLTLPLDGWWDFGDAATVTLNGSNVSQIDDKTGNSRHLVQVTALNQPLYVLAGINGRNVARFNGSATYLLMSANLGTTQPLTLFVVAGRRSGDSGGQIVANNSGTPTVYSQSSVWSLFAGSLLASAVAVDLSVHCFTAVFNNTSSSLRLDATQIAFGTAGTSDYSARPFLIGTGSGGSGPLLGDICEVLAVRGSIGSGQRDACEAYLKAKWGTP